MSAFEASFVLQIASDLTALPDNSCVQIDAATLGARRAIPVDLRQLFRVLQPGGLLHIHAPLAPTKKHRPVYVEALYTLVQGHVVNLLNEYEWLRLAHECGFTVVTQARDDLVYEIEMMDIPAERIAQAKILLIQCPSDLREFVTPLFPPQARLGYVSRRLILSLQKPATC